MADTANTVFRDFETEGVPSSGKRKPKKREIRKLLTGYETVINAFTSNGGLIYTSKASLDADLAHGAKTSAWVINDPVSANNGIYQKQGASGAGSWARVADLPFSFIIASDTGAGTPNAIQATTSVPVSASALIWTNVFEASTASPVTISFNGGAALTIKTNAGNNVAAGGLVAGMIVLGIVSGSTFRLVSDQASASIIAAAEAILAEFKTTYYGPLAADPTLNPEGGAVKQGDLYFNTTSQVMKYYSGSAWVSIQAPDPYASDPEATAGTATNRNMSPARVKKSIESTAVLLDAMDNAHPEVLAAIIQRTGITPMSVGAYAGMTNATAKINEAIDRVLTAGGGILWMPGSWNIAGQLSFFKSGVSRLNMKMLGVGKAIQLNSSLTNQIALRIGDGTNAVRDIEIGDLFLNHAGTRSQFDIGCYKLSEAKLGSVKTDRSWGGVYAEDLNFCEFETINVNAPSSGTVSGTGVYIKSDPAGSGRTDNVRLKEVNIQANGRGMNGMTLDGRVNGVVTDRFYALGVARGCQLISSGTGAGNVPSFTELKSFQVDRASDCSMILDKSYMTTLDCPDLSNTSGILGTADGTTLQINANAITTIIQGGRIGNSQQSAVFFAGKGLTITGGCELMDVSKSGVGARPIMEFAASARDFYVVGNKFKGFSRASNAVALNAAAADGFIKDNTWSALTTGVFNSGTGTNVDISNNKQTAHY